MKYDCHTGWPFPVRDMHTATAALYDAARHAASKGLTPPRLDHTTALNTDAWQNKRTGHYADEMVMNGIKYGFSTQYAGPPLMGQTAKLNHKSADEYPADVDAYVQKEHKEGALSGPYQNPPFTPWFVASPLMTREKSAGDSRRIIVDLSFPDGGINQYIAPHTYDGHDATHNLPTVEAAVTTIAAMPPGDIHMAVIDLSRAYRQFAVTPLDWPLLGIYWRGAWSFDRRLPFGCRMSSYIMQSAADFIVRALARRSVKTHMYLDDIVMISPTAEIARRDFAAILDLLEELGLQVAERKLQQPSQAVLDLFHTTTYTVALTIIEYLFVFHS